MDCTYRIHILGREVCFVDREFEISKILELIGKGYPFPLVIYGSEGCGKTTLLKYINSKLVSSDEVFAIHVDALENFDISKVVKSSIEFEELQEIIKELFKDLPLGRLVSLGISYIVRKIHEKYTLSSKCVFITIDDVYKAIGLENVDKYSKSMYELIEKLYSDYKVKSVLVTLTTSEGVSKRELSRHTYVHIYLMWNLSREGFEELAHQLKSPISTDDLWNLTGGSPRALIDLASLNWKVNVWFDKLFEDKLRHVLKVLDKSRLRNVIEDPDSDWEVAKILEDYNLMIELRRTLTISSIPSPNSELGIGREWAWQIPAYKLILKKHLDYS